MPFDPQQVMAPGTVVVTWQQAALNVPGGIPVGTLVVGAGTGRFEQTARRRCGRSSDFASLDLVGIVVVLPRTDPRDSVLPPRPSPSSTPSPGSTATSSASPNPSASHT